MMGMLSTLYYSCPVGIQDFASQACLDEVLESRTALSCEISQGCGGCEQTIVIKGAPQTRGSVTCYPVGVALSCGSTTAQTFVDADGMGQLCVTPQGTSLEMTGVGVYGSPDDHLVGVAEVKGLLKQDGTGGYWLGCRWVDADAEASR